MRWVSSEFNEILILKITLSNKMITLADIIMFFYKRTLNLILITSWNWWGLSFQIVVFTWSIRIHSFSIMDYNNERQASLNIYRLMNLSSFIDTVWLALFLRLFLEIFCLLTAFLRSDLLINNVYIFSIYYLIKAKFELVDDGSFQKN